MGVALPYRLLTRCEPALAEIPPIFTADVGETRSAGLEVLRNLSVPSRPKRATISWAFPIHPSSLGAFSPAKFFLWVPSSAIELCRSVHFMTQSRPKFQRRR